MPLCAKKHLPESARNCTEFGHASRCFRVVAALHAVASSRATEKLTAMGKKGSHQGTKAAIGGHEGNLLWPPPFPNPFGWPTPRTGPFATQVPQHPNANPHFRV